MEYTELELRDEDAERALMGLVGLRPQSLSRELASLSGEDFHNPHRGNVWSAAASLQREDHPITPVAISRLLSSRNQWNHGTESIVGRELLDSADEGWAANHAATIADLAKRREIIRVCIRAQQIAISGGESAAEAHTMALACFESLDQDEDTSGHRRWSQLAGEFNGSMESGPTAAIIPTPWPTYNELLGGGLHGGRVYIYGGRPGVGKSNVALNIAANAAEEGNPVLVFSSEMSSLDVTGRIIARGAEVHLGEIARYELSQQSRASIAGYLKRVGNMPLWVDDRPRSIGYIKTVARTFRRRHNLAVLVVDYLQLISSDEKYRSREQEVAMISRELKKLSRELDIAVVLPAQLNRDVTRRADPRPIVADLRDSGQIEQDADVITLLHHEEIENMRTGDLILTVGKNRHGPESEVSLEWGGAYARVTS